MGTLDSCPGAPQAYGPHPDLCMLCTACFLMIYQYNKYTSMFNFIDHIHFIPVSGCVGRGFHTLLCLRAYYTVKTTLIIGTCHSGVRQFLQLYVDFQGAVSECVIVV